ncbi:hypothetical protein PFLUV_G00051190 [Perca fluviatilis]|uniref:Uncharacterized protein n=1 Tax=Perca fluviatilis TaxID=8168 RepID=A0A6A5FMV7_PERFL|nr:hypothetical protein PFLUV_G00051190 [Perca fluviatilis]
MVQSETEKSLKPMYEGIAHRYNTAAIEKAHYQWVDRASSPVQFLSAAFSAVDQEDLQRLKEAYAFCGIQPANPTKAHIREHCRTRIPQPEELVKRVEGVFQHFYLATDPNGVPLFKPSMLKTWRIQRIHTLRGGLRDPEVEGGILYRHGGTLQLNHIISCSCVDPHQRHFTARGIPFPSGSVGHWNKCLHRAVPSSGDDRGGTVELSAPGGLETARCSPPNGL